ncbi:hypothetical protein EYZ11_006369 [Aspergillus tanneri]|uniref:Uncharacterized protein n=1 Tax=Aspergillus tanneri TaxID=1220188 RepID=A0A4S3JLI7_9EURO|nr:hypothetical protein EYZ11_006369 [Aspergillus tanneri]
MAAQPRKPLQALNPSTSTPTSNISTRLEKSNPDVCCSIRDLEALASLDDDREHAHLPEATILAPVAKHTRCISVGLLDPEYPSLMASKSDASYSGAHSRGDGQFSVLQRWASRPTLLEELGYDTATVVRVCEDTGDKGSPNSSDGGFGNYTPTQARTIEQLSRENAYLRHAVGQMDSSFRGYAMSSALATSRYAIGTGIHNPHHTQGSVPVGLPVEDLDEVGDIPGYSQIQSNAGRRSYSEHPANQEKQFPAFASVETRTLENVKKAHWDISHGFGNTYDISLSRRHSFADIPIQHIYNSADSSRITVGDQEDIYRGIGEDLVSSAQGQNREYHILHTDPPQGDKKWRRGINEFIDLQSPILLVTKLFMLPTARQRFPCLATQLVQCQTPMAVTNRA